jgi:hypothetical protein
MLEKLSSSKVASFSISSSSSRVVTVVVLVVVVDVAAVVGGVVDVVVVDSVTSISNNTFPGSVASSTATGSSASA